MPKGKKNYTTPHVSIPINNPRRNIPSERDQNVRYRLQQSALDSFHVEIYGPVFLSTGPEAKLDRLPVPIPDHFWEFSTFNLFCQNIVI